MQTEVNKDPNNLGNNLMAISLVHSIQLDQNKKL